MVCCFSRGRLTVTLSAAVEIMAGSDPERNPRSVASPTSNTKETEDERQRTVEGFRSIGVIVVTVSPFLPTFTNILKQAVFMAGLQAQMLAISLPDNDDLSAKFINAFWLAAIFLDVSAVVLATLTVTSTLSTSDSIHGEAPICRLGGSKYFSLKTPTSSIKRGSLKI